MLIALLLAMLFGGGPQAGILPDVTKEIEQAIPDKARQKELVKLYEKMLEEDQVFQEERKSILEDLQKVNAQREGALSEMEASFSTLESKRRLKRETVLSQLFTLRSEMTEEEWDAVYNPVEEDSLPKNRM